jgi:hypothetical protein
VFNPSFIRNAINRSAQNGADRRRFLKVAGAAGLGFAGATYLGAGSAVAGGAGPSQDEGPSDAAILTWGPARPSPAEVPRPARRVGLVTRRSSTSR